MNEINFNIKKLSEQKERLRNNRLIALAKIKDCEDIIKQAEQIIKSTKKKQILWEKDASQNNKYYKKTIRALRRIYKMKELQKKVIEWKDQKEKM